jgi:signal transduction histidine kinase
MDEITQNEWGKAFAAYGLDAATGRLFRGLAHNINGVAQAFSMQTELLQMLLVQADGLLSQMDQAKTLEEAREVAGKLKAMLERRASLVVHLEREVQVIQAIMGRCSSLVAATGDPATGPPFSLQALIETELEFMNGDSFFKHKVKKELVLAPDLPLLQRNLVEIHQILAAFLENAAQSLQAVGSAGQLSLKLAVSAARFGKQVLLTVSDNGAGISSELQPRIFEPFYSTRAGRLGMGLFLARYLAGGFGGAISCESEAGRTTFTLAIPVEGGADGGR